MSPDDPSQELTRTAVDRLGDRWESAWGGGGRKDFALCCTVDVRYEDPLTDGPIQGVDALDAHAGRLRRALPDLRVERTGHRISERGFACLPWRIAGNHRGELGDVPPTERFLTLHGIHYVELRDDLISRARGFFDMYDAAIQLGLLPKGGSLAQSALLMLRGFGLRIRQ